MGRGRDSDVDVRTHTHTEGTITFVAHSLLGAGVTGLVTKVAFGDPTPGIVVGAVLGGLPDTLDWLLATLGLTERWSIYVVMHHPKPWLWWIELILFPIGLHCWLDTFVHKVPGGNWWGEYWWAEIGMWIVGGVLITLNYL